MSKSSALRSALSNRNFFLYVSGNSISLIGFWMQRLAIAWMTWEISQSEFWVGAVAFAELIPMFIICPLFGVWADKFDRKRLTILCQSSMMLQSFVLFAIIVSGNINIHLLFLFALLDGILHAAHQPVRLSIIPNLVEKKDIVAASSFTAVVFNVARFVGPALAGIVIAKFGSDKAVLCNAISYAGILFAWKFISLPAHQKKQKSSSIYTDMKEGFTYIWNLSALRNIFILQTIIALCARPLSFMLAAFAGSIFKGSASTLAVFTSAMGLGAIVAGMQVSLYGKTGGLIRSMLLNTLLALAAIAIFVSNSNLWLSASMIFIVGYSITVSTVSAQTLVQNSVDDEVRGRVLSLWVSFARGGPAIGVLVIGWAAEYFGLMWPNLVAVILCLLGLLILVNKRKDMRVYFEN